jgi:acetyl-CoA C-acetyltransferase
MPLSEVVILDGARIAIIGFGGRLVSKMPAELGTVVAREAIRRAGVDAGGDRSRGVRPHYRTGPEDV